MLETSRVGVTLVLLAIPALLVAQRGRSDNPFPGGTNADGSLRPAPPRTDRRKKSTPPASCPDARL